MKFTLATILILFFSQWANAGWIKRADLGAEGRHRGTACAIDNRVYFGLGHYNGTGTNIVKKDWWEYDPATNAWTQRADYPWGNGNYDVYTWGIDSKVYMCGGVYGTNTMYEYDPQTNTWTDLTGVNMPSVNSAYPNFILNDRGYVASGSLMEFNPQTQLWAAKAAPPFGVSIWGTFFELNDKGYVIDYGATWEYDPILNLWNQKANFPGVATGSSMCFEQDGKGYVVSGWTNSWAGDLNQEVWRYDPELDTWTQLEDFPGTARKFSVACSAGDRSFMGMGTNGTNFNDCWEYDADLLLSTDYLDESSISIYPNPVVEQLTISLDGYNTFDVQLFDALGNEVVSANTSTGECKIIRGTLPAGSYIARIMVKGILLGSKNIILI